MLGYIMPRADSGPNNTKRDPYAVALSGTDLPKTRIGYLGSAYIAIKQRPKG